MSRAENEIYLVYLLQLPEKTKGIATRFKSVSFESSHTGGWSDSAGWALALHTPSTRVQIPVSQHGIWSNKPTKSNSCNSSVIPLSNSSALSFESGSKTKQSKKIVPSNAVEYNETIWATKNIYKKNTKK